LIYAAVKRNPIYKELYNEESKQKIKLLVIQEVKVKEGVCSIGIIPIFLG
jgi:hypothetical protein